MKHDNNMGFLRFVGATLVIFSHSFYWFGLPEPVLFGESLGGVGLTIFFVVSGYLITKSWESAVGAIAFFRNRLLRIIPALVIVSIVTVFIFGPILTRLPLLEYFTTFYLWEYPLKVSSLYFWSDGAIPGVVGTINTVLWSLPVEFNCYILVAIIGIVSTSIFRKAVPVLFLAGMMLLLMSGVASTTLNFTVIKLMTLFLAGSLCYIYSDNIKSMRHLVTFVIGVALLAIVYSIPVSIGLQLAVYVVIAPLLVVAAAFYPSRFISSFGEHGDYSYGLYLYGWPVQMIVATRASEYLSIGTGFVVMFATTFVFAYASWHLIEKRALKYKSPAPVSSQTYITYSTT